MGKIANIVEMRPSFTRLLLSIFALLSGASCEREVTTVIYGTVMDSNKQPVDSILIVLDGVQLATSAILGQVYSDSLGQYRFTVTSKKFAIVDVGIPYWPVENPKYMRIYKGFYGVKNNAMNRSCCKASAGQQTKYDFELISR